MTERRLGITRRKSLADAADGWTEDCHIQYRPASYKDMLEVKNTDVASMDEVEGIDFMLNFVANHLAGGKVMILDDDDQLVLSDMRASDVEHLPPEIINSLFADITGAKLDPKDTLPAPPTDLSPQPDEPATETPSSTN